TTQYFVTGKDTNGCFAKDTVLVVVIDSVDLNWRYHFEGNCEDHPALLVENLTPPSEDVSFHFDFGDGTTSDQTEVEHLYKADGLYALKFIAQRKSCFFEETVHVPVYRPFVPNVFTPDYSAGCNDTFEVVFGPGQVSPSDVGIPIHVTIV